MKINKLIFTFYSIIFKLFKLKFIVGIVCGKNGEDVDERKWNYVTLCRIIEIKIKTS